MQKPFDLLLCIGTNMVQIHDQKRLKQLKIKMNKIKKAAVNI